MGLSLNYLKGDLVNELIYFWHIASLATIRGRER
ncbi:MAG: hypothetical protein ACI9RO_001831 [Alteromonas macleodii]|jgi:hypothetical protein